MTNSGGMDIAGFLYKKGKTYPREMSDQIDVKEPLCLCRRPSWEK